RESLGPWFESRQAHQPAFVNASSARETINWPLRPLFGFSKAIVVRHQRLSATSKPSENLRLAQIEAPNSS
ncbi:MAG: hypothetical protein M3O07_08905, partial [Pseudomonadota bacterium]|nr:hypothetical protein [Pseudomonadota bacterium]